MTIITARYTHEDLLAMPDDGYRYEIIDGEMFVSPTPARIHQEAVTRLARVLGLATDDPRVGLLCLVPVDVRLSTYDIVQPDLLFISRNRIHLYRDEGFIDGPPDLVVEIYSHRTRNRDEIKKAKLYSWAGVPEYWLVDPESRGLRILVLEGSRYSDVQPEHGTLRSRVLPHLTIDVAELFADRDLTS